MITTFQYLIGISLLNQLRIDQKPCNGARFQEKINNKRGSQDRMGSSQDRKGGSQDGKGGSQDRKGSSQDRKGGSQDRKESSQQSQRGSQEYSHNKVIKIFLTTYNVEQNSSNHSFHVLNH